MTDIPNYESFAKIEPLDKGMSSDKKYRIETRSGEFQLLRVSDIAEYDSKRAEFELLKRVAELGVPASRPVDFGTCNGGKSVYQLLTWIDGEELDTALPAMSETEQYAAGLKAGAFLRKIHSIPAPDDLADWAERYFAVVDERLDAYRAEGVPFEGFELMLAYLDGNRGLLKSRPQCRNHGDYHEGNLIISADKSISVIDWHNVDFDGYGDPWYELGRCFSNIQYYAIGEIHGYFDGDPPDEFWRLFAYYSAVSAITSIVWAKYDAPEYFDERLQNNFDVLRWFDNFNRIVPPWYLQYSHIHIQYIDGIPVKLKAPFDLEFIHRYGKVFKVLEQRSGNLCLGVEKDGKRYFVKFAGAPTAYSNDSEELVALLRASAKIYQDLAHPSLIHLVNAEEIGGGFATVFDWTDAECAGRDYPVSRAKFMALPLETRVNVFEDIMGFHAHAAQRGYVAIDFYDASIMYDFERGKTVICDIDLYQKAPYTGYLGKWGSASFVSPEEVTQGAVMDEITTVHTMGQTAFALFSGSDRTPEKWPLDMRLYAVVKRAISDNRNERQQSIRQLITEWMDAVR
ncbi:MAG: phosphotransferase [Oscillospiraceae bacterium]|jgi:serine/threonine-protein kinase|nr:phosphotransferase [Oscillospiraceae bacterium]